MKTKRVLSLLVVCMLVLGCVTTTAGAIEPYSVDEQPIMRATRRIDVSIPAKSVMLLDSGISLANGESVTYSCTYTPRNASIKFGFMAPDGYFYGISGVNGSIDNGIRVSEPGSYTLAIMNKSDVAVTVTGTVNY